jgi:hypothetical protein
MEGVDRGLIVPSPPKSSVSRLDGGGGGGKRSSDFLDEAVEGAR